MGPNFSYHVHLLLPFDFALADHLHTEESDDESEAVLNHQRSVAKYERHMSASVPEQ